jgi:hypothetical protein
MGPMPPLPSIALCAPAALESVFNELADVIDELTAALMKPKHEAVTVKLEPVQVQILELGDTLTFSPRQPKIEAAK